MISIPFNYIFNKEIRKAYKQRHDKIFIHAFTTATFYNLPNYSINNLQKNQNTAARLIKYNQSHNTIFKIINYTGY